MGEIVAGGRLYSHYDLIPVAEWHWPNFTPAEIACPHCWAVMLVPEAMNRLQAVRWRYGKALNLASAYRCPEHNAALSGTGSTTGSHTTGTAFDPRTAGLHGEDIARLENAFFHEAPLGRGKGLMKGVLHLHFDWDDRPAPYGLRSWGY